MLIDAEKSCLIIVDVQEKLVPAMSGMERAGKNIRILMQAAAKLSVPLLVSEQYPEGLGHTIAELSPLTGGEVIEKITFSCMADDHFCERFHGLGRRQVVIAGIEAHVCVLQTATQLLDRGCRVFVAADATASRNPDNHQLAMRRLLAAGAEIVATEMVLFEWLGRAGTADFKEISRLIK